jgi:putative tryptophan/tyrosine transport system substrate-binding protein
MRRRRFIALLGTLMTLLPFAVTAERQQRVRRIGVLMPLPNSEARVFMQGNLDAFQQRLQELGWIAGRNAEIDVRWAPADSIRVYAAELVSLSPDVLLATDTPIAKALRDATQTVPIVFVTISDPVGTGLVSNLARPEGNMTGFTDFEYSMGGKWLDLLKEISPSVTQIAFIFNPDSLTFRQVELYIRSAQDAAAHQSVTLSAVGVRDTEALERAIATLAAAPNGGLIVMPDEFNFIHTRRIAELAERHRVAAVYPFPFSTARGGLLAYSTDYNEQYRRGATYVDRILRGASPADLPIEQPNKFDLSINLKTAKSLGLTVPPSLLARADEVIE